jgi:hypothetical protein
MSSIWRCRGSRTSATAARMRAWCALRPAGTSAGASARPRRYRRSRRSSRRCRIRRVIRWRRACWVRRSRGRSAFAASTRGCARAVSISCRPRTRCRASIWRCGIFWGACGASRCGRCSGTAKRIPSCRTPRCCSATTRPAHSPRRKRSARRGSARRSSGGAPTARARRRTTPIT